MFLKPASRLAPPLASVLRSAAGLPEERIRRRQRIRQQRRRESNALLGALVERRLIHELRY